MYPEYDNSNRFPRFFPHSDANAKILTPEISNICGLVLRVAYPVTGDTSSIEILGKTMHDWIALSLGEAYKGAISYSDNIPLPLLVRPHLTNAEYTVILYSDTPLITRKTILDAVSELYQTGANIIKLTRGYVAKTLYLKSVDKIYTDDHRYFDEEDFITAFSFKQIAMVGEVLRNRIISFHMSRGVQFEDPSSAFIGCDAIISPTVVVGPSNIIKGKSIIREGTKLLNSNVIEDSFIGADCTVESSKIAASHIGNSVTVGPNAHIRAGSAIGDNCRIGNFVEVKKSKLGNGTKVAHLSYVGDAEIGNGCNIGCGTVFCNYDGKSKNVTKVGDNVFIGSNSNLIAPLSIGSNSFIAAGSTVTEDVPPSALTIARSRQVNKENGSPFNKDE